MKKINYLQTISLAAFLCSLLAACDIFFAPPDVPAGEALVSISIGGSPSRTVVPDVDIANYRYRLFGAIGGGQQTQLGEDFDSNGTTLSLSAGNWNFILRAYDDENDSLEVLTGVVNNKALVSGQNNQVVFNLGLVGETGDIAITVNFPLYMGINAAKVSSAISGTQQDESFSITDTEAFIDAGTFKYEKQGVTAGDYPAVISFYRLINAGDPLDNPLVTVTEIVKVGGGLVSEKTITLSGADIKMTTIVPGATLQNKLDWLESTTTSDKYYTVEVRGNEFIEPFTFDNAILTGSVITLIGTEANNVIELSTTGSMFTLLSNGGTLVLDNVTLAGKVDNTAALVAIDGGELVMAAGSVISGNTSTGNGGGVSMTSGSLTMSGGTISGNTAVQGGGVYTTGGTFTMSDGTISGNNATAGAGGGVQFSGAGKLTMTGGTISGNTAAGVDTNDSNRFGGGGVFYTGTNPDGFIMSGGRIENNTAYGHGGGIRADGTGVKLFISGGSTVISGNKALIANLTNNSELDGAGAGIGVSGGVELEITGGTISGNNSAKEGGGVHAKDAGLVTMNGGTITENETVNGGGGIFLYGTNFTLINGTISGNSTSNPVGGYTRGGGGVSVFSNNAQTFTMQGGTISGNRSAKGGGGVYIGSGGGEIIFTMTGGTISGNTAALQGGGVYLDNTTYANGPEVLNKTTGTITGIDGGADSNTAGTADTDGKHGYAVYVSPTLYRDGSAGLTVDLDSTVITTVVEGGNWNDTATSLPEGAIPITSRADLAKIGVDSAYPLTGHYILMNDIENFRGSTGPDDLGDPWTAPIGLSAPNFTGTFNGGNHIISGISINAGTNTGLFGIIGAGGTVENLIMRDVSVEATGSLSGAIAGTNNGTIRNCHVITTTGGIKGTYNVGGITAYNPNINSIIENCSVQGNVSGTSFLVGGIVSTSAGIVRNCFFSGTVESDAHRAGGIAGSNTGLIENCLSAGTSVRATTISGTLRGAGGISGQTTAGSITRNCVALVADVSGPSAVGRIAGDKVTTSTLSNNYALDDMTSNDAVYTWTGTTQDGISGAPVTETEYNTETWWTTAAWHTDNGVKAWTFYPADSNSPWVWNSAKQLPVLRGMPQ